MDKNSDWSLLTHKKLSLGNLVNCLQEHPSEGEAPDEDEEKEDKDNAKKTSLGKIFT